MATQAKQIVYTEEELERLKEFLPLSRGDPNKWDFAVTALGAHHNYSWEEILDVFVRGNRINAIEEIVYGFVTITPLRLVPLLINDSFLRDYVRWRLSINK